MGHTNTDTHKGWDARKSSGLCSRARLAPPHSPALGIFRCFDASVITQLALPCAGGCFDARELKAHSARPRVPLLTVTLVRSLLAALPNLAIATVPVEVGPSRFMKARHEDRLAYDLYALCAGTDRAPDAKRVDVRVDLRVRFASARLAALLCGDTLPASAPPPLSTRAGTPFPKISRQCVRSCLSLDFGRVQAEMPQGCAFVPPVRHAWRPTRRSQHPSSSMPWTPRPRLAGVQAGTTPLQVATTPFRSCSRLACHRPFSDGLLRRRGTRTPPPHHRPPQSRGWARINFSTSLLHESVRSSLDWWTPSRAR